MATKKTQVIYKESSNYFPKELRKKYGLGEYAETKKTETKKKVKKATKK